MLVYEPYTLIEGNNFVGAKVPEELTSYQDRAGQPVVKYREFDFTSRADVSFLTLNFTIPILNRKCFFLNTERLIDPPGGLRCSVLYHFFSAGVLQATISLSFSDMFDHTWNGTSNVAVQRTGILFEDSEPAIDSIQALPNGGIVSMASVKTAVYWGNGQEVPLTPITLGKVIVGTNPGEALEVILANGFLPIRAKA